MLEGKKIILAVSGSIAAYKSAMLCRLLIKAGCEVKIIMTESAQSFVSSLTMNTLSGNSVYTEWEQGNTWSNHVDLGTWADVFILAPATANTISKMAHGQCDNMLLATYLSAKCPVIIAPAMDLDMWTHTSTKKNLELLQSYGNFIIPVGYGFLASGLIGDGRMAEPEEILQFIQNHFSIQQDLAGKKVLITSGPTYEAIDPVRFIGNYSSGKMGFALARACAQRGAEVFLISGPTSLTIQHKNIHVTRVTSADEMYRAADAAFNDSDVIILVAAVADYKPAVVAQNKIKKSDEHISIDLVKTVDIASTLGARKQKHQVMVGFALETNDEINHASQKLHKKNLDFIVLNSMNDHGAGFMHDTNKITILDRIGGTASYELKSKDEIAGDILDYLSKYTK